MFYYFMLISYQKDRSFVLCQFKSEIHYFISSKSKYSKHPKSNLLAMSKLDFLSSFHQYSAHPTS